MDQEVVMQSKEKKAVEGEPRLTPTSPTAMQAISAMLFMSTSYMVAPVRAVQPARGRNTCRGVLSGPSRKDDRAGVERTSENPLKAKFAELPFHALR